MIHKVKRKKLMSYTTYYRKIILSPKSTQITLRLLSIHLWSSCIGENSFWFRIFGKGLMIKHKSKGLCFSQRNGYSKYLLIGSYYVECIN